MAGEPRTGLGGRLPERGQGEQRDAERRRMPGGLMRASQSVAIPALSSHA